MARLGGVGAQGAQPWKRDREERGRGRERGLATTYLLPVQRARGTEGERGSARGRRREGAREAGRERCPPPSLSGGGGAVAMAEGAPVPAETDPLLHEPDCPAGFKPDGEDSDNVAKFKSIIVTPAGEGLDGALRVSTRRHC